MANFQRSNKLLIKGVSVLHENNYLRCLNVACNTVSCTLISIDFVSGFSEAQATPLIREIK